MDGDGCQVNADVVVGYACIIIAVLMLLIAPFVFVRMDDKRH